MTLKYKHILVISFMAAVFGMVACNSKNPVLEAGTNASKPVFTQGYAPVNGIKMYYEIRGEGMPLVLIHGGGSTIETTFGRLLDSLAQNRKVIAVELQSHGHTADADRPFTFEQDADDVAVLMQYLKIDSADFFGFSNGGTTTLQIAIRHPQLVRKAIVASALYKRDGTFPQFWEFMQHASLDNMPTELKEAYKKVAPDTANLIKMHDKCAKRMVEFKDISDADIKPIQKPVLVLVNDKDVVLPEHAVALYRLLPNASLIILPGGHGSSIGEIATLKNNSYSYWHTVGLLNEFLDAKASN